MQICQVAGQDLYEKKENECIVSYTSLYAREGQAGVYVIKSDTVFFTPIDIQQYTEQGVIVLAQLNPGEKIVCAHTGLIENGARIKYIRQGEDK